MRIDYQISEDDYVYAMRLASRYFRRLAFRLAIISIPLILAAVFGPYYFRYAVAGGLAGGIGISIIQYILLPYITRRHYRKYKALHNTQITAELNEEGVKFTKANDVSLTRWEYILKWQQNDRYILLFISPKIYQIIPKVNASPEIVNAFIRELNQRVGKPVK